MKSDELLQFYTLQTPREVQYIPGWILDLENTLFPYEKDIVASWKIIAKRYRLDNETASAPSGFCTLVIEKYFFGWEKSMGIMCAAYMESMKARNWNAHIWGKESTEYSEL